MKTAELLKILAEDERTTELLQKIAELVRDDIAWTVEKAGHQGLAEEIRQEYVL